MIRGKNIYKRYGSLEVLKGVDLAIDKGEVVSIVGPSGSGKSTLLHILGTLDKADMGTVMMDNTELSALSGSKLASFRNRHIGFVFQFHHLLPEFTALENVCIPGWLADRKKGEVREEAERLLTMLGLPGRMENKPNQLSGGEQQRVAVARSLINKPDIIFADEPTGNLDTKTSHEIMDIFGKIHAAGNTVVLVTHEEDIANHAHRVVRLRDGVIESDKRKELASMPA